MSLAVVCMSLPSLFRRNSRGDERIAKIYWFYVPIRSAKAPASSDASASSAASTSSFPRKPMLNPAFRALPIGTPRGIEKGTTLVGRLENYPQTIRARIAHGFRAAIRGPADALYDPEFAVAAGQELK